MVFRLPAPAVEVLVEGSTVAGAKVGDDEADIGALVASFDACDDAADPAPAAGGVVELLEAADLPSTRIGLEAGNGARLQAADVALQRAGRGQAEHVVNPVPLAPVEDFRAGVMAVGANQDRHLWPMAANRAHQAAQKGADLDALRPLRRAQHGGDKAAVAVEDDDRLEAIVVVMGVEQTQLLAAVHRIEGVVDVEGDPTRHLPERGAVKIDERPAQAQQGSRIR